MSDLSSALSGALVTARSAMAAPIPARVSLQAMPLDDAQAALARDPSMGPAMKLGQAAKMEEPPGTYVAVTGETVTLRRDSLTVGADLVQEARHRLAAIDAVLAARPAPKAVVLWLYRLVDLVERPPSGDAMDASVRALATALDMPACCFTDAALGQVARTCVWWPGLAKLEAALRSIIAPMEAERRRLLAIIAAAARPAAAPAAHTTETKPWNRTPEEVARVSAMAAAFAAEMASRSGPERTPIRKANPAVLADAHLMALCEAQIRAGGPLAAAARTRLKFLQDRVAGHARRTSHDAQDSASNPQNTVEIGR